jgi:geranylgeranyl transferase type-1 subunit beta
MAQFNHEKHLAYFRRLLSGVLPPSASDADPVRVVLCYFALAGLDAMGCLRQVLPETEDRKKIADWILSIHFQGSALRTGFNIACVYAAIASLAILESALDALPADEVMGCVAALQLLDACNPTTRGAFCSHLPLPAEADVRFTYAAAASCALLGRWDAIDVPAAVAFVCRCQTYEGAFGTS